MPLVQISVVVAITDMRSVSVVRGRVSYQLHLDTSKPILNPNLTVFYAPFGAMGEREAV